MALCPLFFFACSTKGPATGSTKVVIVTDYGDIELELYDKTPQHRDNFLKLTKEGFYDGTLFHRVIKEFMIQGGDPATKKAKDDAPVSSESPSYTISAEFVPEYFHKRGALAAARQGDNINPQKASSGSQFYIVQGKKYTDEGLDKEEERLTAAKAGVVYRQYIKEEEDAMQKAGKTMDPEAAQAKAKERIMEYMKEHPFHFTEEVREVYKTIGGTPFLDTEYTVFGEVTKGMEVVDKIAAVETGGAARPKKDVKIKKVKIK